MHRMYVEELIDDPEMLIRVVETAHRLERDGGLNPGEAFAAACREVASSVGVTLLPEE